MITPLGKAIRRLRLDRDWLLKDMADGLGVSSSFLSAVETGRKPVPDGLVKKIVRWAKLGTDEAAGLAKAADQSTNEVKIRAPRNATSGDREALAVLARTFGELDETRRAAFRNFVGAK